MATDSTRIFVPQAARVYLAPVGSVAPDGATVAVSAPWAEVGLFAPDSLQMATSPNFETAASHQSSFPTRRWQTTDAATVQCNLQEWSTQNLKAVFGGGSVASVTPTGGGTVYAKFTPPSVGGRTEVACIIEVADGARQIRMVVPRCMQVEGASLSFNKANETTLPLRLSILGSDVAAPWYMLTNDTAAFVADSAGGGSLSTVRITTVGATFSPTVELVGGSTATVSWTVEETGATVTGLSPTLNYGSAATRHVRMTVANASGVDRIADVTTFNVGYDNTQDASVDNLPASYNKPTQHVSGLQGVNLMTGLVRFAAANTPELNQAIDFTGMSALTNIECYASQITGVTLTGCSSLRRLCIEVNALTTLDLNPVAATLRDLRAAVMTGPSLTFATLTSNMANLWHFCVRDQTVINIPPASRLPVVQQMWIWNTRQTGTLTATSSVLTSLLAYQNSYTAATLTGCTALADLDLHGNLLTQAAVDNVLTTVNGFGTSNGSLAIAVNSVPSATGTAARTSLQGRGWTVIVDTGVGVHSDDFQRADATGLTNVGNGWASPGSATANIVSGDLVRTDNAGYQVLFNPAGGDLPADYTVTASVPAATLTSYFGMVGRWKNGEGVTAFFDTDATFANLHIRSASAYGIGEVALTADSAFPASWSSGTGDHTFAMKMTGTLIQVYLDGVLVAHGTSTVNSATTGTGYGIAGEGINRHWHSIGTTVP